MLSRSTQLRFHQLGIIIIAWSIIGFFISAYDHFVIISDNSMGPATDYSFSVSVMRNVGAGLIGALLGGSSLVFFVNVKYQNKPYGYVILAVSIFFIFVVMVVTLVMGLLIVPSKTGKPMNDPATIEAFKLFLTDSHPIKNGIAWAFVVAVTQLLLQVNSKFGQDTFWNIIRGKYNTPKSEKRIFMFLDLNSSTPIAEKLGNETYHALLKDFFSDITDPIVANKGNIYQYVGDEVVISWNYSDGIENSNCLKCFFDMKLIIDKKKEKYLKRYDLIPTFKAGLHFGNVVAGEVGVIKRDITYSGDVLNTASRIQNMCKEFNKEVIASDLLIQELSSQNEYSFQPLGYIRLRGKEKGLLLNSIELV